jgi:hypothetical protein
MSSERIMDPQQINLYAYTRNNPLKYIDPTGEKISLSELSEEERDELMAKLEKESGLKLNYNQKNGLLEILGESKGGSARYRKGLSAMIGNDQTFNVLSQSSYNTDDGVTHQIAFGAYDPEKKNIILDFKDFDEQPIMDLGLAFYHEGVAHGQMGRSDDGFRNAFLETLYVADELGLQAPVTHDVRKEGDKYFLRMGFPMNPNPSLWDRLVKKRRTMEIDVTHSYKAR